MMLEGRTCVFAGATGGDGAVAVIELCRGGMNVVTMTHQIGQAETLMNKINGMQLKGKCFVVQDGECQAPVKTDKIVYREIYERFGPIDVVISNTGDDGFEDSIDMVDTKSLLRRVGHLLGGSYTMLKNTLPHLRKSKTARMIFMTTVEGIKGGVNESFANAAAKGAVPSLTRNCVARLAMDNISANCITKGSIKRSKPLLEKDESLPSVKDTATLLDDAPMGRMGTPEDIAHVTRYLAGEKSFYTIGAVLDVSGGMNVT